ncbi:DUF6378 domain-containing protein [Campylobacter pinnipediorum]|uniref:DUF6378 domain-containing protein n=1 Tax=Campylobacter pinnipediorum TaxID=1965231 RepID=UPI000994DA59|nr:DUF6378 domain-containing protein [Campylobacter pinnipediorum]AQW83036.1 hypothetical protein CPIN17261_1032 [Campylobacter pinnipediorum subsp. pinnipediorum]
MIEDILKERQKTHGDFGLQSFYAQNIKKYIKSEKYKLTVGQIEALEMIAHKIARILAGNPNYKDHWDDIAGYATLVSKELENDKRTI